MEHVDIDAVDDWLGPASVKRPLGRALGATDVAINYYELDIGESFAFGWHYHANQEEVFYVLEGTATFEVGDPREGPPDTVEVSADDLIRFEPGEWQRGWNRDDDRVRALALGAPQESGETVVLRECSQCGDYTDQDIERAADNNGLVTLCVDCGTETGRFM